MGAVHGANRLGGSSLSDCVVFGMSSADSAIQYLEAVPLSLRQGARHLSGGGDSGGSGGSGGSVVVRDIPDGHHAREQPSPDSTSTSTNAASDNQKEPKAEQRSIVVLNGQHYDITAFAAVHPGGALDVADGEDISERFAAAHGSDTGLLDRDSVKKVTVKYDQEEAGEGKKRRLQVVGEAKREVKFFENYGRTGDWDRGAWREHIGRRAWFVLHSFAAKYPEHPTEADQQAMKNLIAAFGQLYPCKLCRKHLQQQLRDPGLGPIRTWDRENLTTWICELHNVVNTDLKKPQHSCDPFMLDMEYVLVTMGLGG
jgi:FAD-linked sulfhydryl oxidase